MWLYHIAAKNKNLNLNKGIAESYEQARKGNYRGIKKFRYLPIKKIRTESSKISRYLKRHLNLIRESYMLEQDIAKFTTDIDSKIRRARNLISIGQPGQAYTPLQILYNGFNSIFRFMNDIEKFTEEARKLEILIDKYLRQMRHSLQEIEKKEKLGEGAIAGEIKRTAGGKKGLMARRVK